MSTVLVTGGSGFLGGHCILQLLGAGHEVRTTVRNLDREPDVRAVLEAGGAAPGQALSFFAADLQRDEGWEEAAAGCDYVLHVASPFPPSVPRHEDELIVPARDGALRVLRAAREGGVKRVVMTSSFAAIGYGHNARDEAFDETVWTDVDGPDVTAYTKSKTLAERAAWDFMGREGGAMELSVINPVGILGPVLGPDLAASILLVKRLLDGSVPGCPKLSFGLVDVRDVADAHLRAMTNPYAKGERFLTVAGEPMAMVEIAAVLKAHLHEAAAKVPVRELPNWVVRLLAIANPELRLITPGLGKTKHATSAKAHSILGWSPRSNDEAVLATAQSLIARGLV